jgi:hypothetical protein
MSFPTVAGPSADVLGLTDTQTICQRALDTGSFSSPSEDAYSQREYRLASQELDDVSGGARRWLQRMPRCR